ncbi:hypothetical protein DSL92_06680 [Billgrantia gudaonensis]|uniref:Uncharacterized protein n=1 Tax=Billgrantia gudaonensis TaxID=376427 RepID=A0A3S0QRK2_9GAMM|nr:hypothetical protein DSL92_06680 [Halomonas gudaonensis]
MIQNLIENASQHAGYGQPCRGTIHAGEYAHRDRCSPCGSARRRYVLPDELRTHRGFYRASPETPGSGLSGYQSTRSPEPMAPL